VPGLTQDQWQTLQAERWAGSSFPALAKKWNISHQAIQKRAKRDGWPDPQDVDGAIRRKVAAKVAGVAIKVAACNLKKAEEAIDSAAELAALVVIKHRQEWQDHREYFASVPADFEEGKHAKITAEMLILRHKGERVAWNLEDPVVKIDISRASDAELEAIVRGKL
jgi:hypothetical protein